MRHKRIKRKFTMKKCQHCGVRRKRLTRRGYCERCQIGWENEQEIYGPRKEL